MSGAPTRPPITPTVALRARGPEAGYVPPGGEAKSGPLEFAIRESDAAALFLTAFRAILCRR